MPLSNCNYVDTSIGLQYDAESFSSLHALGYATDVMTRVAIVS